MRSVLATSDDGVDYVYAIVGGGIRVAAVDRLSTPIKTVWFE